MTPNFHDPFSKLPKMDKVSLALAAVKVSLFVHDDELRSEDVKEQENGNRSVQQSLNTWSKLVLEKSDYSSAIKAINDARTEARLMSSEDGLFGDIVDRFAINLITEIGKKPSALNPLAGLLTMRGQASVPTPQAR